jgi:hypothetical protein
MGNGEVFATIPVQAPLPLKSGKAPLLTPFGEMRGLGASPEPGPTLELFISQNVLGSGRPKTWLESVLSTINAPKFRSKDIARAPPPE